MLTIGQLSWATSNVGRFCILMDLSRRPHYALWIFIQEWEPPLRKQKPEAFFHNQIGFKKVKMLRKSTFFSFYFPHGEPLWNLRVGWARRLIQAIMTIVLRQAHGRHAYLSPQAPPHLASLLESHVPTAPPLILCLAHGYSNRCHYVGARCSATQLPPFIQWQHKCLTLRRDFMSLKWV